MANQIVISDYIYPLTKFGKSGIIHSVFERSFNIKVGEQLINVSNFHDYLSSFGLFLPDSLFAELFPFVQQENRVTITAKQLVIYSTLGVKKVALQPFKLVSLNIADFKLNHSALVLLRDRLLAKELTNKIGLPLDKRAIDIFEEMRQKHKDWSAAQWQKVTRYLIGRGQGLTPSGDDILVAYQTVLFILADERAKTLAAALSAADVSTTDVSKGYMVSAAKGYVNSILYQLFWDLVQGQTETIEKNIERMMHIGHSSGKDLSFGILLALQSVEIDKK